MVEIGCWRPRFTLHEKPSFGAYPVTSLTESCKHSSQINENFFVERRTLQRLDAILCDQAKGNEMLRGFVLHYPETRCVLIPASSILAISKAHSSLGVFSLKAWSS
jgi:hypothetical protein